MGKDLKLNIKNIQIAKAIDLGGLKSKLAKKGVEAAEPEPAPKKRAQPAKVAKEKVHPEEHLKEEAPRVKARSKSAFAFPSSHVENKAIEKVETEASSDPLEPSEHAEIPTVEPISIVPPPELPRQKTSEELRKEIFAEELAAPPPPPTFEVPKIEPKPEPKISMPPVPTIRPKVTTGAPPARQEPRANMGAPPARPGNKARPPRRYVEEPRHKPSIRAAAQPAPEQRAPFEKLGPTGRHIKDLLPPPRPPRGKPPEGVKPPVAGRPPERRGERSERDAQAPQAPRAKEPETAAKGPEEAAAKKGPRGKVKEFRDLKPTRKEGGQQRTFDARDRQGLRTEDERGWRKRRPKHQKIQEDVTVRPTTLKVRLPISIKDLAVDMKLKASQLIAKLFMQGVVATLNDFLEDETVVILLGQEFGCEITIDTSEEQRIRVTSKSIKEEISESPPEELQTRPPVVAFMGHVDHGKTSLIDYIRKSNRAAGEAGAITQHIGAFKCHTAVGDIAILDTPGHEAFSAMRARGADVTDIVVLVVAGDEGIRQQTIEAIQHAKAAMVTIVVAINKCDKPNFDPELVYRQLAEQNLLPEAWGGQTITINCSAVTGEGIPALLEMLALQAEVLELRANPQSRARGSVLESEMHKGLGAVATVLVQNGTLRTGDALVFGQSWGRVKTMYDEFRKDLTLATPSTPVEITGLSGLPEAGEEFIVVKNEREARDIAEKRLEGIRQSNFLFKKRLSLENLFQDAASSASKKILNAILRTDVQGSLEALKTALQKIESQKAELNIIFTGVGEVSESDVQLAAASKAVIIGFHTQIESHADALLKQMGVQVRLHDIIYHAVDDTKDLLAGMLDKVAVETEKGKIEVRATFKSSHVGVIAGCMVTEGTIYRNCQIRVRRGTEVIWKGGISSLKRVKEDVREVGKGIECGILLNGFSDFQVGDILECYEVTYVTQEL